MIKLFLKRILGNKIYWVAVAAAFLLLLCSIVYTDPISGETYTFLSLYYNEEIQEILLSGRISVKDILLGSASDYLWMFAPIITGIPCILIQKTERFVLFRANKNRYFLSKYLSNLIASGFVMVSAYLLFAVAGTLLMIYLHCCSLDTSAISMRNVSVYFAYPPEILSCRQIITFVEKNWLCTLLAKMEVFSIFIMIWDSWLLKKLLSVFCWGMLNAVWGIALSEYIKNKYLILCIPFVWNYFLMHFLEPILPLNIRSYTSLSGYSWLFFQDTQTMIIKILLLLLILAGCGGLIKLTVERRCDCGQK